MSYTLHLRRTSDGLTKPVVMPQGWHDSGWWLWLRAWYACDCHRHQIFQRACGKPHSPRGGCGNEAYTIVRVDDGRGAPIEDWDREDKGDATDYPHSMGGAS